MKKYHQLSQDNKQEVDLKALMSSNQEEDVIETEAVNIYQNEQENNPVNIYKGEESIIYGEDEWGTKVKVNDFTGIHEQEQIPVNTKAIEMMANFLQGLKGGRK